MKLLRTCLLTMFATFGSVALADYYPYCTNGSNTGNGFGWDPSVWDSNGSHSCLVPPEPVSGTFTDGGQGRGCSTPNYTCSSSGRKIGCNAQVADARFTSHCAASYGRVGMVHCYVTNMYGNVISTFQDSCP